MTVGAQKQRVDKLNTEYENGLLNDLYWGLKTFIVSAVVSC